MMDWSLKQQTAFELRDKNILVAAAAGSGKTAVLTERIVRRIIEDDNFDVSRLLVVTFTRAAATEMRQRVEKRLNAIIAAPYDEFVRGWERELAKYPPVRRKEIAARYETIVVGDAGQKTLAAGVLRHLKKQLLYLDDADISTIHSFCQRVIRRQAALAGDGSADVAAIDPRSRIANEQELAILRREVLADLFQEEYKKALEKEKVELTADIGFLRLVNNYGNDNGDEPLYDIIMELYDYAVSEPDPEHWLRLLQADYDGIGAAAVNGDALTELKIGQWMSVLREKARCQLTALKNQVTECLARNERVDTEKSRAFGEFVGREWAQVLDDKYDAVLARTTGENALTWDELCDFVQSVSVEQYNSKGGKKRAPNYTESGAAQGEAEAVKELRKAALKSLAALKENTFGKKSAAIASELKTAGKFLAVLIDLTLEFGRRYRQEKAERRIADFGDLEHQALNILGRPDGRGGYAGLTPAGRQIRDGYGEIMVDEYQDVNRLQETIFTLLTRQETADTAASDADGAPCRFIVGDVKQSIYRFRHSDPTLFNAKKKIYPAFAESAAGDGFLSCRIGMSYNHRSRSAVLRGINYIFRRLMTGGDTEIDYDDGERLNYTLADESGAAADNGFRYAAAGENEPDVAFFDDTLELAVIDGAATGEISADEPTGEEPAEDAALGALATEGAFGGEAEFIARRIEAIIKSGVHVWQKKEPDDDHPYGVHRPVQYRDIVILLRSKGKTEILREHLKAHGIPTYSVVDEGYFQESEIRLVLSLLSIIDNAAQDIPLAAVMRSIVGGFSARELAEIRLAAKDTDYYDAVKQVAAADNNGIDPSLRAKAQIFLARLSRWRKLSRELGLGELIWQLLRETDYYEYVGAMPGGQLRQANLRLLVSRAREFEAGDERGLFRFLRYIDLLQKGKTDLSQARTLSENENVVRIMTIHKSKGMQFPVVILADMGKNFNTGDETGRIVFHPQLGIGSDLIATGLERSGKSTDDDIIRVKQSTVAKEAIAFRRDREMKAEEMRLLYVALTRAQEKIIMTGTVKDLAAARQNWSRLAADRKNFAVGQNSAAAVMEAKSYLDWLGMTLIDNQDGAPLSADGGAWHDANNSADDGCFAVTLVSPEDLRPTAAVAVGNIVSDSEKSADTVTVGEFLAAVKERRAVFSPDAVSSVDEADGGDPSAVLRAKYPWPEMAGLAAKITVTEWKRRTLAAETDDGASDATAAELVPSEPVYRHSNILARTVELSADETAGSAAHEKNPFSGAQFGTLVHGVLRYALQRGMAADDPRLDEFIDKRLSELVGRADKEILAKGKRSLRYLISNFLRSDLGRRARSAQANGRIYCELPFCRLLPVEEVYPSAPAGTGREIFLQGTVDLLFEEDGRLIIVDFKTDSGLDGAAALKKYRKQLEIYAAAMTDITRLPVAEAYIFLLRNEPAAATMEVPLNNGG